MNESVTVAVTTQVFGLGSGRATAPSFVSVSQRTVTARVLIAEHVQAELNEVTHRRTASLALHYMLDDDLRAARTVEGTPRADQEISRAWRGLMERRYMLVVDGVSVDELDQVVTLTERSQVCFVRLLPLVGG